MEALLILLIVVVLTDIVVQLYKLSATQMFNQKLNELAKSIDDPETERPLAFKELHAKLHVIAKGLDEVHAAAHSADARSALNNDIYAAIIRVEGRTDNLVAGTQTMLEKIAKSRRR